MITYRLFRLRKLAETKQKTQKEDRFIDSSKPERKKKMPQANRYDEKECGHGGKRELICQSCFFSPVTLYRCVSVCSGCTSRPVLTHYTNPKVTM